MKLYTPTIFKIIGENTFLESLIDFQFRKLRKKKSDIHLEALKNRENDTLNKF